MIRPTAKPERDSIAAEYPPEFDARIYRGLHVDLAYLNDRGLKAHYDDHGRDEGRVANRIVTREDFIDLAPRDARVLEIGPYTNPMLRGPLVAYCDLLTDEQMRQRAADDGDDPNTVTPNDYLIGADGLDSIPDQFAAILSSHNLEHQVDLVRHLQQARRRLESETGRYFLIVPDKRYCFDHYQTVSTIAQVLEAYYSGRSAHTLQSVIEHVAMTSHEDADHYWDEPCTPRPPVNPQDVREAIELWQSDDPVDVHAWFFTPDTFREIITTLHALGLIGFELERLYPTVSGSNQFYAILRAVAEPTQE